MKDPARGFLLLLIILLTISALTGYPEIKDSQLVDPIIHLVTFYLTSIK
jgi:hypothetical protein